MKNLFKIIKIKFKFSFKIYNLKKINSFTVFLLSAIIIQKNNCGIKYNKLKFLIKEMISFSLF